MKKILTILLSLITLGTMAQCADEFIKTSQGRVELRWFSSNRPANIDSITINNISYKGRDTTLFNSIQGFITDSSAPTSTSTIIKLGNDTCYYTYNQLPVELISFYGYISEETIVFQWLTAWEINNNKFQIEELTDYKWTLVGEVKGVGNCNNVTRYTYRTVIEDVGIKYYRLKQIDFNGDYYYSDIIAIENRQIEKAKYIYIKAFENVWMKKSKN